LMYFWKSNRAILQVCQ